MRGSRRQVCDNSAVAAAVTFGGKDLLQFRKTGRGKGGGIGEPQQATAGGAREGCALQYTGPGDAVAQKAAGQTCGDGSGCIGGVGEQKCLGHGRFPLVEMARFVVKYYEILC